MMKIQGQGAMMDAGRGSVKTYAPEGYAQNSQAAPPPRSTIPENVDNIRSRLHEVNEVICNILERISGAEPQTMDVKHDNQLNVASPPLEGMLDQIGYQLTVLEARVGRLNSRF